ncbi:ArsR family transcriptional regulator [Actinomycetospora cinnamomea]|nr:ArsR family transcriptional regulator [Actinomycetospora cinnamomea]
MSSTGQAELPAFVRLAAHPLRWRLMTELAVSDHRVRELVARVGEPQNLVSYHLRLLRDGGLVTSSRSSFDGRDSYYHLDLDRCGEGLRDTGAALHPALRPAQPPEPAAGPSARRLEVLFVCTGNSARSPIAEALLRRHSAGRVSATSAGTRPRDELHPEAVRALREGFGIDVSGRRPRHLDALADRKFDVVVTLCDKAREVCPEFPGQWQKIHWSVRDPAAPDPTGPGDGAFRRTAADIDTRVRHLLPVLATTGRPEDPP